VAGIIISALLSFVVLAPLREKSANELIDSAQQRREKRERKRRDEESAEDSTIDDA
jgi:mannitol-specific phosphotransferase system IIBC component